MVRTYQPGGLFSAGVDPIRLQAALQQQRPQFNPQAVRMLSAPTTVIQQKNPLNGLGKGLEGLAAGIKGYRKKAELEDIMAPVSVTNEMPVGPGITPSPRMGVASQTLGTLPQPLGAGLPGMGATEEQAMMREAVARGMPTTTPGTAPGPMQSMSQPQGPSAVDMLARTAPPRETFETERPASRAEMMNRAMKAGRFDLVNMLQDQINTDRKFKLKDRDYEQKDRRLAYDIGKDLKANKVLPGSEKYYKGVKDVQNLWQGKQVVKDRYALKAKGEEIEMLAAQGTSIADLGLVFAIAKIFDPTSVVREGEGKAINATAGLPSVISRAYQKAMGTAGLDIKTKKAIIEIAQKRFAQTNAQYGAAVQQHYKTFYANGNSYLPGDLGIPVEDLNSFIPGRR